MSKLIDADDVANAIYHHFPSIRTMADARGVIEEAPSIDIVRCDECIWRDKDNQGEGYCTYVKGLADINEDSFCSWGERRTDE